MSADPRIARIEGGIQRSHTAVHPGSTNYNAEQLWIEGALADLRAWQEIAERHGPVGQCQCRCCLVPFPCPDRQAADAALDRLDVLWAGESRG